MSAEANANTEAILCDILIVGGSAGGCAAALAASEAGAQRLSGGRRNVAWRAVDRRRAFARRMSSSISKHSAVRAATTPFAMPSANITSRRMQLSDEGRGTSRFQSRQLLGQPSEL